MKNIVSSEEAVGLLRKIIAGEVEIRLEDPKQTWAGAFAGNIGFMADGYRIVFFNDCAELDYVDHIVSPDGRRGDFDSWYDNQEKPLDLLTKAERAALEERLEQAR